MVSPVGRRWSICWQLIGVLGVVWSTWAYAERPTAPHLLPEKTLVYVRVADSQEAIGAFQKTSLGRILRDEQVRPLIGKLYQSAEDAYKQIEDRVGLTLDELLQLPQGEACFAVVEAPQGPPVLMLLVDVRDKMPLAEKLLARFFEELGAQGIDLRVESYDGTDITVLTGRQGNSACLFSRDGTVVMTTSVELAKEVLDLWSGGGDVRTLADNPAFAAIMQQSVGTKEERPQLSWFIDPIGLYRNIARGNITLQAGIAFLNPLGLDAVEGIGGSFIMAADEFDTISHIHVLVRSPRRAIPKMLALYQGDNEPERWVPQDIVTYMTLHWDVKTTMSELAKLYDVIRLQEGAFSQLVQDRLSTPLGIDVQTELIPLIEGRISMLTMVERPVRLNSQVTLFAVKVKDVQKGQELLEKVVSKFQDTFEPKSFGATTYYRIRVPERPNRDVDPEMIRRPEPALALIDDYLVVSDSARFIERCLTIHGTSGNSLAEDEQYKLVAARMRRHLGGRTPAMMIFTRPEESMRMLYDLATADATRQRLTRAAQANAFFRTLDDALQEHPLPPFSVLSQYLAPAGAVMISDETGFHYVSFSLKRD